MNTEMILLKATIDAWAINAKREKEALRTAEGNDLMSEWAGQEIAFKRVQELFAKAGMK